MVLTVEELAEHFMYFLGKDNCLFQLLREFSFCSGCWEQRPYHHQYIWRVTCVQSLKLDILLQQNGTTKLKLPTLTLVFPRFLEWINSLGELNWTPCSKFILLMHTACWVTKISQEPTNFTCQWRITALPAKIASSAWRWSSCRASPTGAAACPGTPCWGTSP